LDLQSEDKELYNCIIYKGKLTFNPHSSTKSKH